MSLGGLTVRPVLGMVLACLNGLDFEIVDIGSLPASYRDATFAIVGDVSPAKKLSFQVDSQGAGFTQTVDVGAQSGSRTWTLPVVAGNETLAVKGTDNAFSAAQSFAQGLTSTGSSAFTLGGTFQTASNSTGAGNYPVVIYYNSDPTTDNGGGFRFNSQDTLGSIHAAANVLCQFTNKTSSTIDGQILIQTSSGGTIGTRITIAPNGDTSFASTTAASSSTVAAFTIGNGVAGTSVGIGGGNINAGGTFTVAGAAQLNGGSAASVTTPAILLTNNRILTWRDSAGALSNPGFLWYDSTNNLNFGTSNNTRMQILAAGAVVIGVSDPGGSDQVRINGALTINSAILIQTKTAFTNGAAANAGTLANAPAAGNPTKWIPINDNGTTRYIPAW